MYYWCNFFQPEKLLKVIQLLYKTPRKCRATAIDWSKNLCGNNIFCLRHLCFHSKWRAVWPDLPIYWTLGNFSKTLATISLPKTPTFLGNFLEVSKYLIFLVKSFLGNFYRHLAIFTGHTDGQPLENTNGKRQSNHSLLGCNRRMSYNCHHRVLFTFGKNDKAL